MPDPPTRTTLRPKPLEPDVLERARTAMSNRAELPGMSLLEHLEELRRRIIFSVVAVFVCFFVAYGFSERIFGLMQQPIVQALARNHLDTQLVYTNPIEPFNLYLKIGFLGGIFIASPIVLYQIWLFISPGLYRSEKRYVVPFMVATIGLFLAGGYFGYRLVYPATLDFLIAYGKQFRPMVTIGEYTDLFMTVILGLGVVFELPILVFFLALFGIVNAGWLWRHSRYAILVIFIIAAIITPTTDIFTMCVFAAPMVVLYFVGILVAYLVHPSRRLRKAEGA